MSYTNLTKTQWGSSPKIYFTPSYEYYRSGRDMKYKIKITVQAVSGASYFGYPIYLDLWLDNSQKVDGATIKSSSPSQWTSSIVWTSDELTISNKTTGAVDLKIKLYSGNGSSRSDTFSSADGDWAYLKISPAASTLGDIASFNIGDIVSVPITKYATYYDILTVKYGSTTIGTYTNSSSAGDYTVSADTDADGFYSALASVTSGNFVFELSTYTSQGGTLLGKSSKTVTGTIPSSVKPTASLTVVPYNTNEWLRSKNIYVKGLSSVSAILSGSAGRGSTISARTISGAGETYQGISCIIPLNISGDVVITGSVTDKRGRIGTDTQNIYVYDYFAPYVQVLSYERGTYLNDEWIADDTGEDIAITLKVRFALADIGNECNVNITIDNSEVASSSVVNEIETVLYIPNVDGDSEHELLVIATDIIGSQGSRSTNVLSEAVHGWDVLNGGDGVCFGGAATIPGLDSMWPARFREGITIGTWQLVDFIVETGTNDIWNYIKYASGKYKCWCLKDFGNIEITTQNGSGYLGTTEATEFPVVFSNVENVQVSPATTGFLYFGPTDDITAEGIPPLSVYRPSLRNDAIPVKMFICVIGTASEM